MSKGIKKKHISKLVPGQVCVVLDYAIAMHIAETYDYLANDSLSRASSSDSSEANEHAQAYFDIADDIRAQSAETYYDIEEDEYEDWI